MNKRQFQIIREELMISHSYLAEKLDQLEDRFAKEDEKKIVNSDDKTGLCVVLTEDQKGGETTYEKVVWFKNENRLSRFVTKALSILGNIALNDKNKRAGIVRRLRITRDWVDLLLSRIEKQEAQENSLRG